MESDARDHRNWGLDVSRSILSLSPEKVLLKEQAYVKLKNLIKIGELPPGTFFSERRLTAMLGMSKTPIRSALERLEAEGFVTSSPQQGVVVRDLSLGEIIDLFDLRFALEPFIVRHLVGRLGVEQVRALEDNLKWQVDCYEKGDVVRCTQLDTDFHIAICEFYGNREIVRVMWQLRDKLYRVILQVLLQDPSRMKTSYEEHATILEVLVRGDQELSAATMIEHLQYGKQLLISR